MNALVTEQLYLHMYTFLFKPGSKKKTVLK